MNLYDVRGVFRCDNCLRVLWMTGLPVEDCRAEGCGTQTLALPEQTPALATKEAQ